jgi:hypothetical protein
MLIFATMSEKNGKWSQNGRKIYSILVVFKHITSHNFMLQNIEFNEDLTPFTTIKSQQKTKKKRGKSSGDDIYFYRKHIKIKSP